MPLPVQRVRAALNECRSSRAVNHTSQEPHPAHSTLYRLLYITQYLLWGSSDYTATATLEITEGGMETVSLTPAIK